MENEKSIRQALDRYIRSIHTGERADFESVWADREEATLISITTLYRGKEDIFGGFYGHLGKIFASIDLFADDVQVNMINDALAIVIFRYHTECISRDTNEPFGIKGLETQVYIKEGGEWRLLHVHYSK